MFVTSSSSHVVSSEDSHRRRRCCGCGAVPVVVLLPPPDTASVTDAESAVAKVGGNCQNNRMAARLEIIKRMPSNQLN